MSAKAWLAAVLLLSAAAVGTTAFATRPARSGPAPQPNAAEGWPQRTEQPPGGCTPTLVADIYRMNPDQNPIPHARAVVVWNGCPAPAGYIQWVGYNPFATGVPSGTQNGRPYFFGTVYVPLSQ